MDASKKDTCKRRHTSLTSRGRPFRLGSSAFAAKLHSLLDLPGVGKPVSELSELTLTRAAGARPVLPSHDPKVAKPSRAAAPSSSSTSDSDSDDSEVEKKKRRRKKSKKRCATVQMLKPSHTLLLHVRSRNCTRSLDAQQRCLRKRVVRFLVWRACVRSGKESDESDSEPKKKKHKDKSTKKKKHKEEKAAKKKDVKKKKALCFSLLFFVGCRSQPAKLHPMRACRRRARTGPVIVQPRPSSSRRYTTRMEDASYCHCNTKLQLITADLACYMQACIRHPSVVQPPRPCIASARGTPSLPPRIVELSGVIGFDPNRTVA